MNSPLNFDRSLQKRGAASKMSNENRPRQIKVDTGLIGTIWFIGWLFTIAYAHLIWWQAALGVVIWPYYLGLAAR
jgi:hypothetical protein